jgi:hypothetical protein
MVSGGAESEIIFIFLVGNLKLPFAYSINNHTVVACNLIFDFIAISPMPHVYVHASLHVCARLHSSPKVVTTLPVY